MKKVLVGFVSAMALASVSMTMAGEMTSTDSSSDAGISTSGVFMSGNLGVGMVDLKKSEFNNPTTGAAPSKFRRYGFAWSANLGYMFNQYVGLEAGYQTFGESKAHMSVTSAGTPVTVTDSLNGFDAAVKGVLPVNNTFDVFAKAGVIDMHLDPTLSVGAESVSRTKHVSTWMPMIGAGVAYNVNSNVAVTAQDDYAFRTRFKDHGVETHMPAANDVLAGVTYTFDI